MKMKSTTIKNINTLFRFASYTAALVCLAYLSSCNHDAPFPPSTPSSITSNSNVQIVNMQNISFVPAELTISKGTTVRWVNKDAIPHTATSDQNLFDSGNMDPNATFEFTFNNTGTFNYHCQYHAPHMVGKIIVQ
jgi:plastocyanin